MDEDGPMLGVGFAIDFHDSFGQIRSLDDLIGTTQANIVREFQKIEAASKGVLNLGGAKAQVSSFGNELTGLSRDTARVEKSAEAMVRKIEREIEVFGKTGAQIRQMRAEMRAVDADQRGLTEVAGRLRLASAELDRLESGAARSGKRGGSLTQLSFQLNDVATMAASGAPAFQIFATQAGQIIQVAQMAEGGVKGFAGEVGGLLLRFAPVAGVLALAGGAFALFQRSMVDGTDPKELTKNLGLTKAEIKQLKDVGISTGDILKATFQVMAEQAGISFNGMGKAWSGVLDWMTDVGLAANAPLP
jgi:Prophage tail length tape measure protein